MKKLPKPLLNTKPEEIFEKCISGYRDKSKVAVLSQCKCMVSCDSALYDKVVPAKLEKFKQSSLPSNLDPKEVSKVYTEKFANEDGPGRQYYNAIKEQAERNICPICGIRMVKTLDHYLPKSKFPTLSVTPSNLIPSCRDCNMDKRDNVAYDSQNTPIHIYFDDVPNEPWLQVTVGDNLEILYYISCPDTWDVGLRSRVEKHLDFYNLHELYSSHANGEVANSIHMWKKTIIQSNPEVLKLSLIDECESAELNDMNSWKSALYRGLVANFDKVKKYIFGLSVTEQVDSNT